MEEINSLILHGCKLARELELNLPNLSNHPGFLSRSCQDIASIFGAAVEGLNNQGSTSTSYVGQSSHEMEAPEIGGGMVQEWLRYGGGSQAVGLLIQTQLLAEQGRMAAGMGVLGHGFGGGGGEAQPMDAADSSRGTASSSVRPSRR